MSKGITAGFEFVDDGRNFICSVEPCRASSTDAWWWFSVSTERLNQRYAPFRHAPGDTPDNVRARIVTYFDELLVRRAMPPASRWGGRGPGRPPGSAAAQQNVPSDASDTSVDDEPLRMTG